MWLVTVSLAAPSVVRPHSLTAHTVVTRDGPGARGLSRLILVEMVFVPGPRHILSVHIGSCGTGHSGRHRAGAITRPTPKPRSHAPQPEPVCAKGHLGRDVRLWTRARARTGTPVHTPGMPQDAAPTTACFSGNAQKAPGPCAMRYALGSFYVPALFPSGLAALFCACLATRASATIASILNFASAS